MPAVAPPIESGGGSTPGAHQQAMRHNIHRGASTPTPTPSSMGPQQQQFQRLKVEDALSYLDQVKYKFGNQPQVYNDFLDIMKEFKSQSIDTPGVIARVSNLFKGHPELIVGFNTFLPPGYKIEIQSNDQGYSFQVSVSLPSPTSSTTSMAPSTQTIHHSMHVIPGTSLVTPPPSTNPPPPASAKSAHLSLSNSNVQSNVIHRSPLGSPAASSPAINNNYPSSLSGSPPLKLTHLTPSQVQAHQAVSQALSHVESGHPTPQNQPVEFNHAINYVNKIKNRFQGQPDKYKRFLEILHTYQKEQHAIKEGLPAGGTIGGKQLTEAEVYSQVAKLFENQEDLLAEFGQFLPDATSHQAMLSAKSSEFSSLPRKPSLNPKISGYNNSSSNSSSGSPGSCPKYLTHHSSSTGVITERSASSLKRRSPSFSSSHHNIPYHHHPPIKKPKLVSLRDISLTEAGKYGSLTDYAFFDKVRKALRKHDVYNNFLRCLILFNEEIVSKGELIQLVTPFLGKFPELFRWFKEFIGQAEGNMYVPCALSRNVSPVHSPLNDPIPNNALRSDRPTGELAMEIDYTTCKRLGASYCALPKNYVQPKCSGRTQLCKEVLNNTWVSFPTWSEDSTFVTSRKTQYEEYIYRCEDERFELDVVIETNAATIRVLEGVQKKLNRLSPDEVSKFRLDDCLGGTSATIHQRALRRLYGDKASDIIDGIKKNPSVCVPVALRRLKAKEEEWREAQKGFNKIWREQNEKFYLKSLDHQGMNFKQNDLKALRSKSLFNEIETCFDERHEQAEDGHPNHGPHLVLQYKDKSIIDDAANLLIHHVKRQTSICKEDKQRIKSLIKQCIPDFFHHPRQDLSEDERDKADAEESKENIIDDTNEDSNGKTKKVKNTSRRSSVSSLKENTNNTNNIDEPNLPLPPHAVCSDPDECYTLFFGNNNWYLFFRLHQILCDRLTTMYERANIIAQEEGKYKSQSKKSTAIALRLKPKVEIELEDYYPALLDMVKNVLDGNMEPTNYEDMLREMFGIHAYVAFTLDKVVSYAVRQLQHLVTDETCQECLELHTKESRKGGTGGPCSTAFNRIMAEQAYQRKAEMVLLDENCFKIVIYKKDCKLTIELVDNIDNDHEDADDSRNVSKWSEYVDQYVVNHSNAFLPNNSGDEKEKSENWKRKAVFLPRNIRLWKKHLDECKNFLSNDSVSQRPFSVCDNTQCRFTTSRYRMVFVVKCENILCRNEAMTRARKSHPSVSKKLTGKFQSWHESWIRENVSKSQIDETNEWLLGRAPDTAPNLTRIANDNPLDKAPYRPFNRYRVTMFAKNCPPVTSA
ncbi:paired amphipathic helix protein Sin3a [Bemisia tabaci]|uniref:paired amphipathic helix protein Sin3a n=1 Tax=Bemisia tabaci TaxID=7038 RepID=UPI0008F9A6E2|nr:PREDICTED: paired amphipathic helix protein Sin3b [Bemisia tabaci]